MSFRDPRKPENWAPIDDEARNGECQLVRVDDHFALARYAGDGWAYPASGIALNFDPDDYLLRGID